MVETRSKERLNSIDGDNMVIPSLTQIKKALPAECFESSLAMSMYYVVRTCVFISALAYGLYWFRNESEYKDNEVAWWTATAVYSFLQGTVFWGVFTLGHDCGHSSFSRYPSINWVMGTLLHGSILTPFESWRISHRHHHKNTGNIDTDEVFYPHREVDDDDENNSRARTRSVAWGLGFSWFLYLITGFNPRSVKHFSPSDPLFARHVTAVTGSLAYWAMVVAYTLYSIKTIGFEPVFSYYLGAIWMYATWLVVTTFLHHNDEDTPWYGNENWDYVKGNLSSVDRTYGIFNNVIHNIGTHQIHHLFPIIPHYKLVETTKHFKEAFPHLVRESQDSILFAFYKNLRDYVNYGSCDADAQFHSIAQAKARAGKKD